MNPFADLSNRFAVDQLFRKHGYRIAKRPKKGPTIWTKAGEKFTQKEVLKRISVHEVDNAVYLEDMHLAGLE